METPFILSLLSCSSVCVARKRFAANSSCPYGLEYLDSFLIFSLVNIFSA